MVKEVFLVLCFFYVYFVQKLLKKKKKQLLFFCISFFLAVGFKNVSELKLLDGYFVTKKNL